MLVKGSELYETKMFLSLLTGLIGVVICITVSMRVSAVLQEAVFNQLLKDAGKADRVVPEKIVFCIESTDVTNPKMEFDGLFEYAQSRMTVLQDGDTAVGYAKFSRNAGGAWRLDGTWDDNTFLNEQIQEYGNGILYINSLSNPLVRRTFYSEKIIGMAGKIGLIGKDTGCIFY